MDLLPKPKQMSVNDGSFILSPKLEIVLDAAAGLDYLESAKILQQEILEDLGCKAAISKSYNPPKGQYIYLKSGSLEKEAYTLTVTEDGITISSGDDAGMFYGVQTMRQLIRSSGRQIPCITIDDSPYFKTRVFYHDVTRGKVPTLDTLKRLADIASFYKINQLQLYVEHSFAFKAWSEVWAGADPLTAEEIVLFDEYCRKKHIELVPSMASFGHLFEALRSQSYRHLNELEEGLDKEYSWLNRNMHDTIDITNPESFEFIKKAIEEFVPLFTSNKFNICCDETFDLGKGKNKELAAKVGTGRMYIDFLKKIISVLKNYDKQVMFWADIILEHPELIAEIPDDVICLDWEYSPKASEDKTRTISGAGKPFFVCPTVHASTHMMARFQAAYDNIRVMTGHGKKYNAEGVLNTDWGDYGHIAFLSSSIPGMIYGADFSWNPDESDPMEAVNRKISILQYGDSQGKLLSLLSELGMQQVISFYNVVWWQEEPIVRDEEWFKQFDVNYMPDVSEEETIRKYYRALELENELSGYLSSVREDSRLDAQEFVTAARGTALFNSLYLILRKHVMNKPVEKFIYSPKELAVEFEYWLQDFNKLWRARNKESERYRITEMFKKVCRDLRRFENAD